MILLDHLLLFSFLPLFLQPEAEDEPSTLLGPCDMNFFFHKAQGLRRASHAGYPVNAEFPVLCVCPSFMPSFLSKFSR